MCYNICIKIFRRYIALYSILARVENEQCANEVAGMYAKCMLLGNMNSIVVGLNKLFSNDFLFVGSCEGAGGMKIIRLANMDGEYVFCCNDRGYLLIRCKKSTRIKIMDGSSNINLSIGENYSIITVTDSLTVIKKKSGKLRIW